MVNWRKPVLYTAYCLAGNRTLRLFAYLKSVERLCAEELQRLQGEKLRKLLLHAYRKVPYYHEILPACGAIKNDKVRLENFCKIPFLTKRLLREQGMKLYAEDYEKRGYYVNHTGGSTGEPVNFLQDKHNKAWGMAYQYYASQMCGRDIGEPMLKLWGSERDVFRNAEKLATRFERWLSNAVILNSFLMSEPRMTEYARMWNKYRPTIVNGYTSSVSEFARYLKLSGKKVSKPKVIMCCAETLSEDVRSYIEEVFGCPAVNYYGGRDISAVACECPRKEGLHVFSLHNKVEILNAQAQLCRPTEIGEITVTTLNNFSMPLIRYRTGDTGIPAPNAVCSCGRGWPLIRKVMGRQMEIFRTKDGTAVPGEFFIHAVGVVYNKDYVKKFQVVQEDYDCITIRVVVRDKKKFDESKTPLVDSIKKVMGTECRVEFEEVDDIKPAASGKFQYTISKVAAH